MEKQRFTIPENTDLEVSQQENKIVIEFVPNFKEGDILTKKYKDGKTYIFILDYIGENNEIHYKCYLYLNLMYLKIKNDYGIGFTGDDLTDFVRPATEQEIQTFFGELEKEGKRWNAETLEIEDISKFKAGDKVRIKEDISSKTHRNESPYFISEMDKLRGKTLTVDLMQPGGCVLIGDYNFYPDWLELVEENTEELEKDTVCIFWDFDRSYARLDVLTDIKLGSVYPYRTMNTYYVNAIKFESVEQYKEFINGGKISNNAN